MNSKNNLTTGNAAATLVKFAIPFLLACFLQTFYGMVDMYVVGKYNGAETITAVSVGSQIMHMITVMTAGFTMGITVRVGKAAGEKNEKEAARAAGASSVFFLLGSVICAAVLLILNSQIVHIMKTPEDAVSETGSYLRICIAGMPLIMLYNIISSIYRGAGDSKSPMLFISAACAVNVFLDFLFVGTLGMGAKGAALATVSGQLVSCIFAAVFLIKKGAGFGFVKEDFTFDRNQLFASLKIGFPVAMQDGFIQIAFIIITVIANMRGLTAATAVGIVEKIIGFMFLVPSAMLSAVSAITAQNMGAGDRARARLTLRYGLVITAVYGLFCAVYCQFLSHTLVGLFTKDAEILAAGCDYLRSYSFDCMFAGMHFCFSGYFCGDQKSEISFVHNIISILVMRIPGAYLASRLFADSLWPMGLAAPLGSLLSVFICAGFYIYYLKKERKSY